MSWHKFRTSSLSYKCDKLLQMIKRLISVEGRLQQNLNSILNTEGLELVYSFVVHVNERLRILLRHNCGLTIKPISHIGTCNKLNLIDVEYQNYRMLVSLQRFLKNDLSIKPQSTFLLEFIYVQFCEYHRYLCKVLRFLS